MAICFYQAAAIKTVLDITEPVSRWKREASTVLGVLIWPSNWKTQAMTAAVGACAIKFVENIKKPLHLSAKYEVSIVTIIITAATSIAQKRGLLEEHEDDSFLMTALKSSITWFLKLQYIFMPTVALIYINARYGFISYNMSHLNELGVSMGLSCLAVMVHAAITPIFKYMIGVEREPTVAESLLRQLMPIAVTAILAEAYGYRINQTNTVILSILSIAHQRIMSPGAAKGHFVANRYSFFTL